MTRLQEPSWRLLAHDEIMRASDAMIAAWKRESTDADAVLLAAYTERAALYAQIQTLALKLWGGDHAVFRALKKAKPIPPSNHWTRSTEEKERAILEWRKSSEAKVNAAREAAGLAARAVLWLAVRGKKPGVDYEPEKAVATANDIAASEETARLRAESPFHSFAGSDGCNESCSGWDGESRRCECGNRRVGWEKGYSHTFENPVVYPEGW